MTTVMIHVLQTIQQFLTFHSNHFPGHDMFRIKTNYQHYIRGMYLHNCGWFRSHARTGATATILSKYLFPSDKHRLRRVKLGIYIYIYIYRFLWNVINYRHYNIDGCLAKRIEVITLMHNHIPLIDVYVITNLCDLSLFVLLKKKTN